MDALAITQQLPVRAGGDRGRRESRKPRERDDDASTVGEIDAQFSDGAKKAMELARERLFQPDWKKVFEPENVIAEVKAITQGTAVK